MDGEIIFCGGGTRETFPRKFVRLSAWEQSSMQTAAAWTTEVHYVASKLYLISFL